MLGGEIRQAKQMKFILYLYLCSFNQTPTCDNGMIVAQFNSWRDCAIAGYRVSQENLKLLPIQEINEKKLAVRFECRQIGAIT